MITIQQTADMVQISESHAASLNESSAVIRSKSSNGMSDRCDFDAGDVLENQRGVMNFSLV